MNTAALGELVDQLLELDTAPVVQAGHPVLRTAAAVYDGQLDDQVLDRLFALMTRTMHAAPGVGLAAPQIGVPLALAVVEDPGTDDDAVSAARERPAVAHRVLVNPVYAPVGDEQVAFYEGCLSVSGWVAVVSRHRSVRLTCTDEAGRAVDDVLTGWPARIVQHETDHLRGTLYLDKAETRSLATGRAAAQWAAPPWPTAAAAALGFELPAATDPGPGAPRGIHP